MRKPCKAFSCPTRAYKVSNLRGSDSEVLDHLPHLPMAVPDSATSSNSRSGSHAAHASPTSSGQAGQARIQALGHCQAGGATSQGPALPTISVQGGGGVDTVEPGSHAAPSSSGQAGQVRIQALGQVGGATSPQVILPMVQVAEPLGQSRRRQCCGLGALWLWLKSCF
jgi:hypothetical protein